MDDVLSVYGYASFRTGVRKLNQHKYAPESFSQLVLRVLRSEYGNIINGFHRDNGRENGNYCSEIGYMLGL